MLSIKPTQIDVIDDILADVTLSSNTKKILVGYSNSEQLIDELNITFLEFITSIWNQIDKQKLNNIFLECNCLLYLVDNIVKMII